MKIRWISFLLFSSLWVWLNDSSVLSAEPHSNPSAVEPPVRLTLQDCISIALENQPAIGANRFGVRSAREHEKIARSFFFPQVRFEARYTRLEKAQTASITNPFTDDVADVFTDGAAFFQIAKQAGSAAALNALDNPNTPLGPGLPSFNGTKQIALNQLPAESTTGLLGKNSVTTEFLLLQPLWTGGKIRYRYQQSKLGTRVASADLNKSEQTTAFHVTHAYWGVLFAQEMTNVVTDATGRFRAIESLIKALIDQGDEDITTADLYRAETIKLLSRGNEVQTEYASELAHAALNQAMGIEHMAEFVIEDSQLPTRERQHTLPVLLNEAMDWRPELTKAGLGIEVARLERKLTKAQYAPDVGFFGRFSTIDDDEDFPNPNDSQRRLWAAGIVVGVPLFTGGRRSAQRRDAEFQQAKARQIEQTARSLITLEVQKVFLEYQEMSKQLHLTKKTFDAAEKTVDGFRNQYLGGLIEDDDMPEYFEDLINSQILQTQARTKLYETRYKYNLSLARIRLVTASNEYQMLQD